MTWTTDGSGLQVKRIRGRTMPQAYDKYLAFLGLEFMRAHRRNRADKRLTRTRRRWNRWADQWIQYRSAQYRAESRTLRRRAARLVLEAAARALGLEVRLGEFSRDLRARIGAAQIRALGAAILRPTYERLMHDMEPPIRDTFAKALGLKVTETPSETVVLTYGTPGEAPMINLMKPPLQALPSLDEVVTRFDIPLLQGVANVARAEDEQRDYEYSMTERFEEQELREARLATIPGVLERPQAQEITEAEYLRRVEAVRLKMALNLWIIDPSYTAYDYERMLEKVTIDPRRPADNEPTIPEASVVLTEKETEQLTKFVSEAMSEDEVKRMRILAASESAQWEELKRRARGEGTEPADIEAWKRTWIAQRLDEPPPCEET